MTEEEVRQLKQAYADLKEEAARKDQRIEELEALLMRALLRIEELERRLGKIAIIVANPIQRRSLAQGEPAPPQEREALRRTTQAPGAYSPTSRDA